jgi:hypothetical protein
MKLDALFELFDEARRLSGHRDFVIIGSLSALGLEGHFVVPADMTMSNDVDAYTLRDPGRIFELNAALGEESPFHRERHYFLDPVSPQLPTLPDGWEARLILVERVDLRLWFLEPNDAAVSKYARGEMRDRRWVRAGIRSGIVSLPVVSARLGRTSFLDDEEQARAKALFDEDKAWFDGLRPATGR